MQVSFLLGSGFSAPDDVKTVGQINDKIKNLTLKDIYIHSDMTFMLLNGTEKPSYSLHYKDELFFIEFINFYLTFSDKDFNYEEFYDFIMSYGRFGNHKKSIEEFFEHFKTNILKTPDSLDDLNSFTSRFSDYFNRLISNLLQTKKYYEDVGLGNYPPYDSFISYLAHLVSEDSQVNVHSLNHDLLFEHIASKHSDLWQHFTDGYSDEGSRYYGKVNLSHSISKTYKVRLKCFQNNYDKPLQLIKLHGSVDTYIANIDSRDLDLTRVKKDWGVGEVIKEVESENGSLEYRSTFQFTYPDILSGASSKAIWYKQPHYKELIEKFIENPQNTEKLIVIGYGFKDDGINYIIENEYLITGKLMVVIDIRKPDSRLVNDYNVKFVQKSISELTLDEWLA